MIGTFNRTITLFNKIAASDAPDRKDHWRKTVIGGCAWQSTITRSVAGTNTSIGESLICRIPEQDNYKPYFEYKKDPENSITLNVGDIVFLGIVDESPETTNDMLKLLNRTPNAFMIKVFKDNAIQGLMPHYRIEGI